MHDQLSQWIKTIAPGGRASLTLPYSDPWCSFSLPVFALRGQEEGPLLWVQAALHGDEYDGIPALLRLMDELEPSQMAGTLLLVPVISYDAFLARTNGSPADGENLNRCFPGDPQGSHSQRYASWLLEAICAVADYHIDLHGGGQYLDVANFAMMSQAGSAAAETALSMARWAGVESVCQQQRGDTYLFAALAARHIPAILIENGGGVSWAEDAVHRHYRSVLGIMAGLGLLRGQQPLDGPARVLNRIEEMRFPEDGLQLWSLPCGQRADRGDKLIEYAALPGLERRSLLCPLDNAIVLSNHISAAIRKGDYGFMVGSCQ